MSMRAKIRFALAFVLMAPMLALAQSYPSPTFNNLTVNGTFTLSGGLPPASLAAQAANTILANATGSLASPTAVAMPTCSASGNALNWTSGTGPTCQALTAHTFGLGTTDTPTFYGVTLNGSTQHGLIVGGGNGNPATYTSAGISGYVLTSNGASADPTFQTLLSQLPAFTGDCTTIAGTVATTCATSNGSPIVPTVATISALKALSTTVSAAIGRVYVAGYYAASDGGGGYFTWNGASSTADNGGTFIQPSSLPASGRWVRDGYLAGRYSPIQFGAYADGTHDDAAPIRAAMLALSGLTGGGTLQLTCNTTYNLASDAGNGLRSIIYPYSNVNMVGCGASSVLKVAAGMNNSSTGYFVIYPQDSSSSHPINNVQFREFKIDDNGTNNSCSNTCYYNNVNIGAAYGDGILVDGVTVVNNPGSQDFSFGANTSFPVLSNIRIVNSRDENSCDLVNTACTDFSGTYLDAVNGVVANNTFYEPSQSTKATAFELHGFNLTATGNTVWNYNTGTNVAAQGGTTNSVSVVGNTFVNVYTAARMWANSGNILANVTFAANAVQLTDETKGPALDLDQDILSGSSAQEITVSGNTFTSGQATGTTNIFGGVRLGEWVHQNIVGNTFRGFSGPAVYIGSTGTVTNNSVINISDNTITDAGSTSTTASKVAIQLNSATNAASFSVHGNVIQSDTGYATTGIGGNVGAQVAGMVYGNPVGGTGMTTAVNITGTNTKVGVTCTTGSPSANFSSYMGVQTHC